MTTQEIILGVMAVPASYGIVQVFGIVDRHIERLKKGAFKLSAICKDVGLDLLCVFFEAIAVRDISGAVAAAKGIRKSLKPDKLWGTLREMFFKQLIYRLANIPEDAAAIYKAVDKQRVIDRVTKELEAKQASAVEEIAAE